MVRQACFGVEASHTGKATWAEFKLGIKASANVPGGEFRSALDQLQQVFDDAEMLAGTDWFKRSINAWIGLYAITERTAVKTLYSP